MTPEEARVGARVTWDDEINEDNDAGVVVRPTEAELRYFAECNYPPERSVLVSWNGVGWDRAWQEPSELRLLPDEAQPEVGR